MTADIVFTSTLSIELLVFLLPLPSYRVHTGPLSHNWSCKRMLSVLYFTFVDSLLAAMFFDRHYQPRAPIERVHWLHKCIVCGCLLCITVIHAAIAFILAWCTNRAVFRSNSRCLWSRIAFGLFIYIYSVDPARLDSLDASSILNWWWVLAFLKMRKMHRRCRGSNYRIRSSM